MAKNKSGKSQNNVQTTSSESSNFLIVLFYCLLIIFSPIVAFFGCKVFVFDDWLTPVKSNIYSAVVSVVALHVALGLYLFRASQDSSAKQQQKED